MRARTVVVGLDGLHPKGSSRDGDGSRCSHHGGSAPPGAAMSGQE